MMRTSDDWKWRLAVSDQPPLPVSIEDEEGNLYELEVLGSFEVNGQEYLAALPADMEESDPDYGIILLKIEEEDGMEVYAYIDDDDELDLVYETYMQLLDADEEAE